MSIAATPPRRLTPPEVAKTYRVDPATVIGWIKSGELRAVNVASKGSRRPRWRIDPADLAVFENGRAAVTPKTQRRRRRKQASGVVSYF